MADKKYLATEMTHERIADALENVQASLATLAAKDFSGGSAGGDASSYNSDWDSGRLSAMMISAVDSGRLHDKVSAE